MNYGVENIVITGGASKDNRFVFSVFFFFFLVFLGTAIAINYVERTVAVITQNKDINATRQAETASTGFPVFIYEKLPV